MHEENNKPLQIQDKPDSRGSFCTINIDITWELAEKITNIAAPIIKAIGDSVDTRTAMQIERESRLLKISVEQHKKQKIFMKHLYKNIKKIHTERLEYYMFCRKLENDARHYYPYTGFSNTQRQKLYKRIRAWSVQTMYKKGLSTNQIQEELKINKSQIYNYKNMDRRSIDINDNASRHRSLSHHTYIPPEKGLPRPHQEDS